MTIKLTNEDNMDSIENSLFPEFENEWEKEWHDMPEFIQENKEPYQQIIIGFKNFNDVKNFGYLINQKLTPNTKSLWFPKKDILPPKNFVYENES